MFGGSKQFKLPKQIGKETHFTWGPVVAVHTIGPYDIVEFRPQIFDEKGFGTKEYEKEKTQFSIFVDGKSTSSSCHSLDAAIIAAIAYRRLGCGNHATPFVCRMLEIKDNND
jgi:hypothetical protein